MMRLKDWAYDPKGAFRLFVWGMPLSGKSSLGKKLKKLLAGKVPVWDLDKEMETRYKRTISDIFAEEGEEAFRLKEAALLRELVEDNRQFVIITGGGTPCFYHNDAYMRQAGGCCFMHTPMSVVLDRASGVENRPLLSGNVHEKLREIYNRRLPVYETAHAEFASEKEMLDWVRDEVMAHLG